MKKFVPLLALMTVAVFVIHLVADRVTPYTDNARVKAIVIPITPQVSGYVSAVAVNNYEAIDKDETILQIDPTPYSLAVQQAQAELEQSVQAVGVNAAEVEIAQSELVKAQVAFENTRLQANRIVELKSRGLVSQSRVDDIRANLDQAQQNLTAKQAALIKSEEKLGHKGKDNPAVKQALSKLELAKLELAWSRIQAPSRGMVVDLKVGQGTYAKKGQAMMTFISGDEVWIDAFFTENNLGNVAIGNKVDIVLDAHPGRVFSGKVVSLNAGASSSRFNLTSNSNVNLPPTPRMTGWMRDPQRFPVRVVLDGHEQAKLDDDVTFRFNGQADIMVYTQASNGFMDTLGQLWMRVISYISYAY